VEQQRFPSLVFEETFEADCAKLCPDQRVMDDHLHAIELLLERAERQQVRIPVIPDTNVLVVRLESRVIDGHVIPPTRTFLRFEGDGKGHLLAIEAVPPDEYLEHEAEQLEMPFTDDDP